LANIRAHLQTIAEFWRLPNHGICVIDKGFLMSAKDLARIIQINVNPHGGVPKYRVAQAEITMNGVAGDKQRDWRYYGGPSRAVSLYALEHIQALQAEGHRIKPGSTGENLTIRRLDWAALQLGDCLRIGDRVLIGQG
jgi:MOSC domain-containing protein YiiM